MIILCPGSAKSQLFKRWPAEKFAKLGTELIKLNHEVEVLIGKEEENLMPFFYELKVHTRLPIKEVRNLLLKTDLCICNDSFLMHLSSLLDVKTLAIYGPTDPKRTLPPEVNMIQSPLFSDTRPCWGKEYYGKCNGDICTCLDGLEVENLIQKVLEILT